MNTPNNISTQVKCPDCEKSATLVGAIPDTNRFAGQHLESLLPGGFLWRCDNCKLGFRHPQIPKKQLDLLYEQGNDWSWSGPPTKRNDWNLAQGWVSELIKPGSKVLDVGCFDGGFLTHLLARYDCYGIEIHPVASERAAKKGIKILAKDFFDLEGQFDLITAFDVIEHMQSPAAFLEKAAKYIRHGGMLIVSTGNLDSKSFKFMGSRYWYCTIAEHISFISPFWVSKSIGSNYRVIKQITFSHSTTSLSKKGIQTALNILYRTLPSVFRVLRRIGMGGVDAKAHPRLADLPPSWITSSDHFIVLLQRT
jgi:2-polyprenyl-3-methyl-5-hydroxy-6-metoxy-1,4-benzoquinol methylase